jgi:GT2 family glycosyltransferase
MDFRFFFHQYSLYTLPSGGEIFLDRRTLIWIQDLQKKINSQEIVEKNLKLFWSKLNSSFFDKDEGLSRTYSKTISIILVTYNSSKWLPNLERIIKSSLSAFCEVIVIDNGSNDHSVEKMLSWKLDILIHPLSETISLASAINKGCELAKGQYFFVLNPDVSFTINDLDKLLVTLEQNPHAALVVPKLRLMKTPGFLNGMGNTVTLFRHGYDLGLGHLDLGQFDSIREIPSACFAAVMIPRDKFLSVGPLDEIYPLYYEDSDWCFRARQKGYSILIEPSVVVYHAYGGHQTSHSYLANEKIRKSTFGRLRFVSKHSSGLLRVLFLSSYFLYDMIKIVYFLVIRNFSSIQAIFNGWACFKGSKKLSCSSDHARKNPFILVPIQNVVVHKRFKAKIHKGLPLITWTTLILEYLPICTQDEN